MKNIIKKIIGDENRFDLSHRILNISLLFGAIISVTAIITNYILDLHIYTSLIALSSFIVFSFSYLLSIISVKSKLPTIIGLGFLTIFFSPVMWFANGGSTGGFQYYIFFFLAGILVITKGKIRLILILLFGITMLSSLIIEFYHPEYVILYPSKTDRYLDLIISFIIAFVGAAIYIYMNIKQYTVSNIKLNLKNQLLNQRRQEIFEHKRKIELQKTEIEEKAKSLENLNKTKDRFFSIISHDLKSPFNSLLGLTELLKLERETMSDEEIDHLIDLIHQSSEQGYKLVLNILEWSRAQTDQIEYKPAKLDLYKLAIENVELLKAQAENKSIDILVERFPKNNFVFADQNMINTVLRNLISNAIKYTEKGEIKITINCNIPNCKLSIKDTGIGISKESLKKLFDIDYNTSTKGTLGEKGTGLGLILCKEFIEKNNGEIFVESTVNKGSTFSFSLPLFKN
ncbi:MAG: ATP-binding protein [Bacteroidota bacterium]